MYTLQGQLEIQKFMILHPVQLYWPMIYGVAYCNGAIKQGPFSVVAVKIKSWLIILPSSCYKFPYKSDTRIWC